MCYFRNRDHYGSYTLEASETFDNRTIEWRKYDNSPMIKKQGGKYCNYCLETNQYKFYRNDYIRGHSLNKFIRDALNTKSEWDEDYYEQVERNEDKDSRIK